MKKIKKLCFSMGAIIALGIPISTIIACAVDKKTITESASNLTPSKESSPMSNIVPSQETSPMSDIVPSIDEQKIIDQITEGKINELIISNKKELVPNSYPTLTNQTIDGVSNLTITFKKWFEYIVLGIVDYKVSISKENLNSKEVSGRKLGWSTRHDYDQAILKNITNDTIGKFITTDSSKVSPSSYPALTNQTIDGSPGFDITFIDWTNDVETGTVSFTATIYKENEGLSMRTLKNGYKSGWFIGNRLDAITMDTIQNLVVSNKGINVPYSYPTLTNQTIDGISGLTIKFIDWVKNYNQGSASFNATISKEGVATRTLKNGYKSGWFIGTNIDGITMDDITPLIATSINQAVPNSYPTLTNQTIDGISGITLFFQNWEADPITGTATFNVQIKHGIFFRTIEGGVVGGWEYKNELINITMNTIQKLVVSDKRIKVPSSYPTLTSQTIDGISGLTIKFIDWVPNDYNGTASFNATISKGEVNPSTVMDGYTVGWLHNYNDDKFYVI